MAVCRRFTGLTDACRDLDDRVAMAKAWDIPMTLSNRRKPLPSKGIRLSRPQRHPLREKRHVTKWRVSRVNHQASAKRLFSAAVLDGPRDPGPALVRARRRSKRRRRGRSCAPPEPSAGEDFQPTAAAASSSAAPASARKVHVVLGFQSGHRRILSDIGNGLEAGQRPLH